MNSGKQAGDSLVAKPPQQSRSLRSLEKILDGAEQILAEDGVDGLTIVAIANRSGVSVGGICRRFTDKQKILRALKDRVMSRLE